MRAAGMLQRMHMRLFRRDAGQFTVVLHQLVQTPPGNRMMIARGEQRARRDSPCAQPGAQGLLLGLSDVILARVRSFEAPDKEPSHIRPVGGWNAGNAFVYGVPLRPHIDATAIALAALRPYYHQPIVRDSLTWLLDCIQCPSAYSLSWLILAVSTYQELRSDITPTLVTARDRLAALVDDPRGIQDTSTIALAALALGVGPANNPFEVNGCERP